MQDYRANSNKAKAEAAEKKEKPKFTKVIDGDVTVSKNGILKRIFKNFIKEDARTVFDYALEEVVAPGLKTVLANVINTSVDMFFWGKGGKTKNQGSNVTKISYENCYGTIQQKSPGKSSGSYFFADPEFPTRDKADEVLKAMKEALALYQNVSVADLYDMAGVTGSMRPNDNKYGWRNLDNAEVVRRIDGKYVISFPNAVPVAD